MSWNDFSIAVGEMLTKEGYGYNPKKKSYTKMVDNKAVVADVNNEEVYFFDGSEKCMDDPDGILAALRVSIMDIVGAQVASPDYLESIEDKMKRDIGSQIANPDELPVKNDIEEHIKETESQKANEALGKIKTSGDGVQYEGSRDGVDFNVDYDEAGKQIIPSNAPASPVKSPQPYKPQGTIIHGFVPQLKEIGKIKIGRKGETRQGKSGDYRLPEKFDHFEVVTLQKDEHLNFIPDKIMGSLDTDPKELDIILLYNDPTLNFYTRYNEYKGGKRQCSGDGKLATDINDNKITCNPEACPKFLSKRCKPNGILSVILTKSPRLGGVYKFRTTGWNSIRSILSSMMFLQTATGGTLAGIPLKLTLTPQQAQPKDSPTAHTIYVVNIEFAGTMDQLLNETIKTIQTRHAMQADIQRLESTARLALDAPESEEEIEDIQAEFYPDGGAT